MSPSIRLTALAVAVATTFPAFAQSANENKLAPVVVTATGIPYNDAEATYASEVHDRADIEASGATTLYDYLAQHTSLNVLPNYGNKATPLIDMRGYGGNGFQNIVITVDGQRLNNIDGLPQLIGAIPLDSIESIEISKGSGSVLYGDGAMAGTVQIHTRARTGASASAVVGSYGVQSTGVAAGFSKKLLDLSFSSNNDATGGTSEADSSGHRTASAARTEQGRVTFKPSADLKLFAEGTNSHIDTRYPNALTLAQFDADPGQHSGGNYTHQIFDSRDWKLGGEFKLSRQMVLAITHGGEDKDSTYAGSAPYSYDTYRDTLSLHYQGRRFDLTTGVQIGNGLRRNFDWNLSRDTSFSKDNSAAFAQMAYRIGATTVSAGLRREQIAYVYKPGVTDDQTQNYGLNAWDLGVNRRFNDQLSVFANINSAFQAPDIDRAFDSSGNFLGFIAPAKVKTLNVGINHDIANNRLRLTVFRSYLHDEIYFQSTGLYTGFNTNIDKSHKYGLELQDTWKLRNDLNLNLVYTYTRAIIDSASQGGGAYDGKELPGVPHHGLTLGLGWQPWAGGSLDASQVWRASAYSANDFSNSLSQRQAAYQSTNLSFRQRWGKVEGFAAIDNLFGHKNGLWINDNVIYPVDFSRIVKLGVKFAL